MLNSYCAETKDPPLWKNTSRGKNRQLKGQCSVGYAPCAAVRVWRKQIQYVLKASSQVSWVKADDQPKRLLKMGSVPVWDGFCHRDGREILPVWAYYKRCFYVSIFRKKIWTIVHTALQYIALTALYSIDSIYSSVHSQAGLFHQICLRLRNLA